MLYMRALPGVGAGSSDGAPRRSPPACHAKRRRLGAASRRVACLTRTRPNHPISLQVMIWLHWLHTSRTAAQGVSSCHQHIKSTGRSKKPAVPYRCTPVHVSKYALALVRRRCRSLLPPPARRPPAERGQCRTRALAPCTPVSVAARRAAVAQRAALPAPLAHPLARPGHLLPVGDPQCVQRRHTPRAFASLESAF